MELTNQQIKEAMDNGSEVTINVIYNKDPRSYWYRGFFSAINETDNNTVFKDNKRGKILLQISEIKSIIPFVNREDKKGGKK